MDERFRSSYENWDKLARDIRKEQIDSMIYQDTYDYVLSLLRPSPPARVLELACGQGFIAQYFLDNRPELDYLATNTSESSLSEAVQLIKGIKTDTLDYADLDKLCSNYDLILHGAGISKIPEGQVMSFFTKTYALLNANGYLYIKLNKELDESDDSSKKNSLKRREEELNTAYSSAGFKLDRHFIISEKEIKSQAKDTLIYILKK